MMKLMLLLSFLIFVSITNGQKDFKRPNLGPSSRGEQYNGPSFLEEHGDKILNLNQKNFDQIVYDRNKDVFVEFYANWCGHCKSLVPHWKQLAENYRENKNIVIAKIDAEQYKDIAARFGIQGYPTLILFSKGNKRGEWYKGKRDAESFSKWLDEQINKVPSETQLKEDVEAVETIKKQSEQQQVEQSNKQKNLKDLKESLAKKQELDELIKKRYMEHTSTTTTENVKQQASFNYQASSGSVPTQTGESNQPRKQQAEKPKKQQQKQEEEHQEIESTDEGTIAGVGGTQLFYQAWAVEGPKGVIILLHDLGDHSGSYGHIINHIVPKGYSIYSFDLRGHGRSQGQKGHINDWNDYREDLRSFINYVKKEENTKKVFIMGFSLGGLIAIDYSIRYRQGVQGVIAISPMLSIHETHNSYIGSTLSIVWPSFTYEQQIDYKALTRDSDVRIDLSNDPLWHGSSSVMLINEIKSTIDWVQSHATELKVPILLSHGDSDKIVPISGTVKFYESTQSSIDKMMINYDGSYHRIFDDIDREKVLDDILSWLENHL